MQRILKSRRRMASVTFSLRRVGTIGSIAVAYHMPVLLTPTGHRLPFWQCSVRVEGRTLGSGLGRNQESDASFCAS